MANYGRRRRKRQAATQRLLRLHRRVRSRGGATDVDCLISTVFGRVSEERRGMLRWKLEHDGLLRMSKREYARKLLGI